MANDELTDLVGKLRTHYEGASERHPARKKEFTLLAQRTSKMLESNASALREVGTQSRVISEQLGKGQGPLTEDFAAANNLLTRITNTIAQGITSPDARPSAPPPA